MCNLCTRIKCVGTSTPTMGTNGLKSPKRINQKIQLIERTFSPFESLIKLPLQL
jgi:hypothetical protein